MTPICGLLARSPSIAEPVGAKLAECLGATFRTTVETVAADPFQAAAAASGTGMPAAILHHDGLVVVADARIDDREVLGATLGIDPASPAPALIAAAWRRWHSDCPLHLLGDYAFVIHDTRTGETFAARDHIGARPFFYVLDDRQFAFASHIAPLLDALEGLDAFDDRYVATALSYRRFEPHDRTHYRHIAKLAPGHRLHLHGGEVQLSSYWEPDSRPEVRFSRREDYVEAAREAIERAVADRLRGIEHCAVHLSGGLDSSTVAAVAVRQLRDAGLADPPGYSWHPIDPQADPQTEPGWSEAIRAHLGLELFAPECDEDDLREFLRQDRTRGPDLRNLFHEHAVQRHAATRGARLILSGWGGDEGISFNRRGYSSELLRHGRLVKLARQSARPGLFGLLDGLRRAQSERALTSGRHPTDRELANSFLRADFLAGVEPYVGPHVRLTSYRTAQADLLRRTSVTQRLEDWALTGFGHAITYAFPLLDRRVLDIACGLPPDLYEGALHDRMFMREIAAAWLPDAIRLKKAKREPIRTERIGALLLPALRSLAPEVAARRDAPRARYVDIDRLAKALATVDPALRTQQWPMRLAVQFLDL